VKRIIYLAAIVPKVGESHADAMPGPLIEALLKTAEGGGYMHTDPVQLAAGVGNDFDSWEFAYECALKLPHHSAISVPVSYILTEKDLVLSPGKFARPRSLLG
jgi:hypothetical protein